MRTKKKKRKTGARKLTKSGLRGESGKVTQRMKDREAKGAIRQTPIRNKKSSY